MNKKVENLIKLLLLTLFQLHIHSHIKIYILIETKYGNLIN